MIPNPGFSPVADVAEAQQTGGMGHLTTSIWEGLASLGVATMLMWAPVFGFAYVRRRFGGAWQNYLKAYFGVCALTVAAFVLLAICENVAR